MLQQRLARSFGRKLLIYARQGAVLEPEPMDAYREDPVGFCRDILGVTLWSGSGLGGAGQVEIMLAVMRFERVSVAACYASGKTFTAACLVLWWIYTRRPAMVITTAPTGRQVKTLLWREIRKLHRKARVRLAGRILQTALHIAEDWWGMGFASDAPNSVAGLHEAENVLFIEDEAAGMEAHVVEGFEGITASDGSRHLKIGNPICDKGPFLDSHVHPEESQRWHKLSIDAEDTPNVRAGRVVVPGLVTRDWVEDKRHRWLERGLLHLWETKVKGKFHLTAAEKVVTAEWVALAQARWTEVPCDLVAPNLLAVDVAGGGQDETIAAHLLGSRAAIVQSWQTEDLMRQAREIGDLATTLGVTAIIIDRTGLGQGVWSRLQEMSDKGQLPGIQIIGVALNESPDDADTYASKQDEIQFELRWALDPTNPEAVAIEPADKQLAEELSARTWHKTDKHKVQVESKRALRKRGIGSPDRADAMSLLFAPEARRVVSWVWV